MRTAFTQLCSIRHPVAGFSRSPGVVAEVSRGGGLGVMAASSYSPAELDAQLRWIADRTQGAPFGVDLLVPSSPADGDDLHAKMRAAIPERHLAFVDSLLAEYGIDPAEFHERLDVDEATVASLSPRGIADLLEVAFAHPIALIANALGPPPELMLRRGHELGIPVAALVGNGDHARRQCAMGVDVLVAQGTEAGGHTGTIATTVLTPEVVAISDGRPVLAAGGIATGAQMAAALALGADGVWCGSVWLSSEEDITPRWIKEKFLEATSNDTVRSRARTGKPARQLRSPWHDAWDGPLGPEPLPMQQQVALAKAAWSTIESAADAGSAGARELGSFFVGQVVGGFTEIQPTLAILDEVLSECAASIDRLQRLSGDGGTP